MTDRIKGFVVSLEHDVRIDDVEPLIQAIRLMRGVADVQPSVSEPGDHIIQTRMKVDIRNKLWRFINDNL